MSSLKLESKIQRYIQPLTPKQDTTEYILTSTTSFMFQACLSHTFDFQLKVTVYLMIFLLIFHNQRPFTAMKASSKSKRKQQSSRQEDFVLQEANCPEKQNEESDTKSSHQLLISSDLKEQLVKAGIEFSENFQSKGSLSYTQQSEMSMVAHIQVGCYKANIAIIRIFTKSWFELSQSDLRDNILGAGSFGKVMKVVIQNSEYACKHIKISKNNLSQELYFVLKQFLIVKIAGTLGVGPRVQNKLGYDVVLFDKQAVFLMDKALEINYLANWVKPYERHFQQQLTKSLNILHSLNIIHGDIKPDNIMWDPTREKFIFVDFGFSKILESKGPTLCSFFGTINYCCPQMAKQYLLKSKGLVDLEQNDRWGLKETIQRALKSSKDASSPPTQPYFSFTKNQFPSILENQDSFVSLLHFYFHIFLGDTTEALKTVKKETNTIMFKYIYFSEINFIRVKKGEEDLTMQIQEMTKQLKGVYLQQLAHKETFGDKLLHYIFQYYNGSFHEEIPLLFLSLKLSKQEVIRRVQKNLLNVIQFIAPFKINLKENFNSSRLSKCIKIVQLLYNSFDGPKIVEIKEKFFLKLRYVALSIFEKLKSLHPESASSFSILRDIFITIQDYPSCILVEREILSCFKNDPQIFMQKENQFMACLLANEAMFKHLKLSKDRGSYLSVQLDCCSETISQNSLRLNDILRNYCQSTGNRQFLFQKYAELTTQSYKDKWEWLKFEKTFFMIFNRKKSSLRYSSKTEIINVYESLQHSFNQRIRDFGALAEPEAHEFSLFYLKMYEKSYWVQIPIWALEMFRILDTKNHLFCQYINQVCQSFAQSPNKTHSFLCKQFAIVTLIFEDLIEIQNSSDRKQLFDSLEKLLSLYFNHEQLILNKDWPETKREISYYIVHNMGDLVKTRNAHASFPSFLKLYRQIKLRRHHALSWFSTAVKYFTSMLISYYYNPGPYSQQIESIVFQVGEYLRMNGLIKHIIVINQGLFFVLFQVNLRRRQFLLCFQILWTAAKAITEHLTIQHRKNDTLERFIENEFFADLPKSSLAEMIAIICNQKSMLEIKNVNSIGYFLYILFFSLQLSETSDPQNQQCLRKLTAFSVDNIINNFKKGMIRGRLFQYACQKETNTRKLFIYKRKSTCLQIKHNRLIAFCSEEFQRKINKKGKNKYKLKQKYAFLLNKISKYYLTTKSVDQMERV